ncbi:MAG: T9SS type A sorting domain-containing protein [Chitinophagales bacterium]
MVILITSVFTVNAQHSVARQWNDVLLESIREDYARPTIHARNLFHVSAVMYDAWAALSPGGEETYLLGKTVHGYECEFNGIQAPANVQEAQEEAISYAVYRMLQHRFQFSPNASATLTRCAALMNELGYDVSFTSKDYSTGSYAALGNYIASEMIDYGLQDGSNEAGEYGNLYYSPVNPTLVPIEPGNPDIVDPNHWQPLTLQTFIDQSGNVIPINTPKFLSPEWGGVYPFSLKESDQNIYQSNGDFYSVYHDPGHPPYIDDPATKDYYIWNFTLVAVWASHLDPADSVMWDVSPASIGNNPEFPTSYADFPNFYNLEDGGDQSRGWEVNPATGQPYEPQIVPRGDYARILAEFWADGPDSETPPGHWFTLLNYVNDHPLFEKRFKGEGPILDDLEWDVKAYFIMGGTMHDVAVTSWGIKGYYDYIRPISAIRYMADQGQSSDNTKPNYSENGLPLMEGLIELVEAGDDLAGDNNENVDKIKLYTWRGPDYIDSAAIDEAGVGWILAENWWPYQRPTFITPPFAGFVSGHSTYSRAAAEVMTMLTGDAFFPGGMGEFEAPKNEFLVFEEGPSQDITLQWATYRDASDQCSLSRIWGGIHPPADDMPGRIIGEKVGIEAFDYAAAYFDQSTALFETKINPLKVYPNPIQSGNTLTISSPFKGQALTLEIINSIGELVYKNQVSGNDQIRVSSNNITPGMYVVKLMSNGGATYQSSVVVQ